MTSDESRFTEQWDALDPFDPDYPHLWVKVEHLGRYLFAREYLRDRRVETVADVGCGTGYGARELASIAARVIAVDANDEPLRHARELYATDNIEYRVASADDESLSSIADPGSLDAVVCFETLEHLTDPFGALGCLSGLIRPSGYLILSVPNGTHERVDNVGLLTNTHHRRMFSISGITELVRTAGFGVIEVLGQPLAAEINRSETRLIRRKQTDRRIGDEPALHQAATIRQLAMVTGYPEQRDVEWSYSVTVVARRR